MFPNRQTILNCLSREGLNFTLYEAGKAKKKGKWRDLKWGVAHLDHPYNHKVEAWEMKWNEMVPSQYQGSNNRGRERSESYRENQPSMAKQKPVSSHSLSQKTHGSSQDSIWNWAKIGTRNETKPLRIPLSRNFKSLYRPKCYPKIRLCLSIKSIKIYHEIMNFHRCYYYYVNWCSLNFSIIFHESIQAQGQINKPLCIFTKQK